MRISHLFYGGERLGEIFKVLVLLVPILLSALIDKAIGGKLSRHRGVYPDGRALPG